MSGSSDVPSLILTVSRGFMHLASGLSVGLAGVAAGYTIGIVGDAVRDHADYTPPSHLTAVLGSTRVHATVPCLCRNDSHIDLW